MKVANAASYEARLGDMLRSVRDVVRRRILTLALVTLGITLIGTVLTYRITPTYQAITRIQIDPSRNPLARVQNEAQAQLASEAIETEVSVINSLDVSRYVVNRLNLMNDPEFAPETTDGPPLSRDTRLDITARNVNAKLSATRDRLTYIIGIRFTSTDSKKAAKIANAFAAAYLDTKVGNKIGTAERQSVWYQRRMNELAAEVRAADERVATFQAQSGIVRGSGSYQGTIVDQQVGPLSLQLASAESFAAEARSKENSARGQVRRNQLDAITDVRESTTIQDLRRQRAILVQTLKDVEVRYGPRHPDLIKVRDQIEGLDQQIREESTRVLRSLDADADASEARAQSLRTAMQELEQKQANNARASVIAAGLQRDADSKHNAYDKMAQLALETRQATQNSIAQAEIIDTAKPPLAPSWPNRPLLIMLSFVAGLGVGIAVITTQELMVSGMRTAEEVEDELGIPLIAAVPAVKKYKFPADLLIEKPTSQFAEALRNARASIIGVRADARPKVIALTSALPSEGKTTTALSLARTMALNGDKTIIVDVDVRRAQLRQILPTADNEVGIVEVLHGEATLEKAIRPSDLANLDQIIVQAPYFSSENLFGNNKMPEILEQLSAKYDAIILDLPPLIGLADGRFLAALADVAVLVIRWDQTPKHAISSAVAALRADGTNLVGAMFTLVDTSSQSVGSYYYYSKQYTSYYQQA